MPRDLARAVLFETHDMHLQVPGSCVARDQSARIATGACCVDGMATALGRVDKGGVTRRRFAMDIVQLLVIDSRFLYG
jgi:hypothetical protein